MDRQERWEAKELKRRLIPVAELSNVRNGWLAPDGKLYSCDAWSHDWLMRHLEKLTGHKEFRFVKLSRSEWYPEDGLSVKQIDSVWDWCQANREEFPEHLIEDPLYRPRKRQDCPTSVASG